MTSAALLQKQWDLKDIFIRTSLSVVTYCNLNNEAARIQSIRPYAFHRGQNNDNLATHLGAAYYFFFQLVLS